MSDMKGRIVNGGGSVSQTSMTTMAREYMSDSLVTLIALGAGSGLPSNIDRRSGAIHLIDPALFTVDACADSASAVMDASPKSHRIALLSSSMRMLGCTCSVCGVAKDMKLVYVLLSGRHAQHLANEGSSGHEQCL